MRSVLAVVCPFLGLITSGYSLICTHCSSDVGPLCFGTSVPCNSTKHVCTSLYQVTTVGSEESMKFVRSCEERRLCGKLGIIGINDGKYRISITCCESDRCTPSIPTLPPITSYENGLSCPTCISYASTDCSTNDRLNCTGDEKHCVTESTEATDGSESFKSAVRGCANEGYCEMGNRSFQSGSTKLKVEVTCNRTDMKVNSALTLLGFAIVSILYVIK
ncbi:phospholipase A2 inhibitor and Ly6/PLAUR domain-containing protein-like [Mixophyes fleayi]|uniref:phospholipase A2 inhibitor and Ly6/PLAUR domain-containing protein-like n=1 Tax=Mixophyes fleayi TaxID=3061075 RepID=UPI003F4E20E7